MRKLLTTVIIIAVLTGCGGSGSSDGGIVTNDTTKLSFNFAHNNITGDINVKTFETLALATATKTVELKNFVITTDTPCTIKSQNITPDILTFLDDASQNLTIDISFTKSCNATTLTLTADESINVTAVGTQFPTSTNEKTFTFKIYEQDGSEASNVSQNPVSTMSMTLAKTEYREPFFIDTYSIHSVDENGNPPKDGESLSVGVINQTKFYAPNASATLTSNGSGSKLSIDNAFDFTTLTSDDRVVITANKQRLSPSYLGGWSIDYIQDANNIILKEAYTSTTSSLDYAIGDEKRLNSCDSTLATASFATQSYSLINGNMQLELKYDPYMVGKDVFLYAQINNLSQRIGISRKQTLKGTGIETVEFSCDNSAESNTSQPAKRCVISKFVRLKESGHLAKNINFNSYVCVSGECSSSKLSFTPTNCEGSMSATLLAAPGEVLTIAIGNDIKSEF